MVFPRYFRLALIFSFILSFFAGTAYAGLTKISENVYSYVGVADDSPANSFGVNAGIVIGDDGILVVDAMVSSKEAKRFISDIKAVTGKPIKYVVNTHGHLDHAFGNCEFKKLGATIIAHANAKNELAEMAIIFSDPGLMGLTKEDLAGTEIVYPDETFEGKKEIDLGGGVKVELIYAGPAHTRGDTLVYVPEDKVVFTGDVLFTDFHPYLAEGDMENWPKVLDRLMEMDAALIPGHGPLSANKDASDMKEYLALFDRKARELAAGKGDAGALTGELTKALPARKKGAFLIQANMLEYIRRASTK